MPRPRLGLTPEQQVERERELARLRRRRNRAENSKRREAAKTADEDTVVADHVVGLEVDASALATLRDLAADWGVTPRAAFYHLAALADGADLRRLLPPPVADRKDRPRGAKGLREDAARMTIRYVSAFAGIDGAVRLSAKALTDQGRPWSCQAVSQWEPGCEHQFAAAVLTRHEPLETHLADLYLIDPSRDLRGVDVLVGGSPCQAFSMAGMRLDTQDERGQLTRAYMDLADGAGCRVSSAGVGGVPVLVWENVGGVLSSRYDRDPVTKKCGPDADYDPERDLLGSVLGYLAGADCAVPRPRKRDGVTLRSWPRGGVVEGSSRVVAWAKLDASKWGLPQARQRVFLVACRRGDGLNPAEILGLKEPPKRQKRPTWRGAGMTFYSYRDAPRGPDPEVPVGNSLSRVYERGVETELHHVVGVGHAKYILRCADRYVSQQLSAGRTVSPRHMPLWLRVALELAAEGRARFHLSDLRDRLDSAQFAAFEEATACGAALIDAYGRKGYVRVKHIAATLTKKYGAGPAYRPVVVKRDGETVFLRSLLVVEAERLMGLPDGYTDVPGYEVPTGEEAEKLCARLRMVADEDDEDEDAAGEADDDEPGASDDHVPAASSGEEPAPTHTLCLDDLRFAVLGNAIAVPPLEYLFDRIDAAIRKAVERGSYRQEPRAAVRSRWEEDEKIGYSERTCAWTFGGGAARFSKRLISGLRRYGTSPQAGEKAAPAPGESADGAAPAAPATAKASGVGSK